MHLRHRSGAPGLPLLLLLPFAGGNATSLPKVTAALSDHFCVYTYQYPGRMERVLENPEFSIPQLAQQIYDELLRTDRLPKIIFGHSMGGLIGFEVMKALAEHGAEVPTLIAAACVAPHATHTVPEHPKSHEGIIEHIQELGGTDPALLEERSMAELIVEIVRADYQAVDDYKPSYAPYPIARVIAVGGELDEEVPQSALLEWGKWSREQLIVREYGGGHFFLEDHPHELTELLRTTIHLRDSFEGLGAPAGQQP